MRFTPVKKLVLCALIAGIVVVGWPVSVQSAASTPLRFGIDMKSFDRGQTQGLDFSFGVFWVGSWTQKQGWRHTESQLRAARQHGVTPVINWWYWGDDIAPRCLTNGCYDDRQKVQKDKATWYRMSDELSQVIARTMGNRETLVVLETEFNKGGIENYEPFDGHLAEVAEILKRRGNVKVVLGFGNWGRNNWARFDRAVAASDMVGTQLLRSSIRDKAEYGNAVDTLVDGARFMQRQFNKPSLIVDLAISSYPASTYEARQARVARELRRRLPELKAAGVRGILYRSMADNPAFDTSNYHGIAERHWGLLRADGSKKPAFAPFAAAVRAESSN
jgi:hypothetical protein